MSAITIRNADDGDLDAVLAIYNAGIRERIATFETEERARLDVEQWIDGSHPFLVAEREGRIVGWIRASAYRPRRCYAGIGDLSVYVAAEARGAGIGNALMPAFLTACERAGLWKLVGRIFVENAPSRALCARHGFREVGTYEKHGRLDGAWRDVVVVERLLERNL